MEKSISVKMFHLGKWSQTFNIMNTRQDPLPTERFREKTERNKVFMVGEWNEKGQLWCLYFLSATIFIHG